jgi:hypothetical protein
MASLVRGTGPPQPGGIVLSARPAKREGMVPRTCSRKARALWVWQLTLLRPGPMLALRCTGRQHGALARRRGNTDEAQRPHRDAASTAEPLRRQSVLGGGAGASGGWPPVR